MTKKVLRYGEINAAFKAYLIARGSASEQELRKLLKAMHIKASTSTVYNLLREDDTYLHENKRWRLAGDEKAA